MRHMRHDLESRPGGMILSYLISTPTVEQKCPYCKASILVAYVEGARVRVHSTPVDTRGELSAIFAGQWTYARLSCGELVHRDPVRIRGGLTGQSLHVAHGCPT
jgi:hypothetical protein